MKTNEIFAKGMLIIAIFAFILVSCDLDKDKQLSKKGRSVDNTKESVHASDMEQIHVRNTERVSSEIFGNKKIKSSEYLYNLDDSPDFIYVDFEDYGYAVYFTNTMELMEYAPWGSLPYPNTRARRYYGGPTNYLNKENEQFINTVTNLYREPKQKLLRGGYLKSFQKLAKKESNI